MAWVSGVDGGAGFDLALISGDTGVAVDLSAHGLEAILGGGDTFGTSGSGPVALFGKGGNDTLTSGPGDDVLQGHAENDVLLGEAGADTLEGGAGDDVLAGWVFR